MRRQNQSVLVSSSKTTLVRRASGSAPRVKRNFDPFWAEKDDIDEDGHTDNPDWLVGSD